MVLEYCFLFRVVRDLQHVHCCTACVWTTCTCRNEVFSATWPMKGGSDTAMTYSIISYKNGEKQKYSRNIQELNRNITLEALVRTIFALDAFSSRFACTHGEYKLPSCVLFAQRANFEQFQHF